MGRVKRARAVRKTAVKPGFPQVFVDRDADFASIKLASGVEARSYERDGFVFCEDRRGRVIEVQVLNLSDLRKRRAA